MALSVVSIASIQYLHTMNSLGRTYRTQLSFMYNALAQDTYQQSIEPVASRLFT